MILRDIVWDFSSSYIFVAALKISQHYVTSIVFGHLYESPSQNGSRDTSYIPNSLFVAVLRVFSDGFFLSRAGSSVIRAVFGEKQCWGGEDRHYGGSRDRRKRTEVSNLEKVQGLGSFVSFHFTQRTILTS